MTKKHVLYDRKHHNGELLGNIHRDFNFDSLWHAYTVYQNCTSVDVQDLLHAYNNPQQPVDYDPAVKYLCDNWNSTWIRHGLEKPEINTYGKNQLYPPLQSRMHIGAAAKLKSDRVRGWYAVELETPPFNTCATHGHGGDYAWAYVAGLLPVQYYTGKLHRSGDRDHYYADTQIPEQQWLFVYDHIHTQDPAQNQLQNTALQQLLNTQLMTIPYETVQNLHTLHKHLRQQYTVRGLIA